MTLAELRERVSAEEFDEWRAYDRISPLGDYRTVRQLALLAAVFANVHRGKGQEPFEIDDMDLYRDPVPPLTRAQEEARFRAAFELRGLVVVKKKA